jgi:hypothetical protein
MINKIFMIFIAVTLASCGSISDKAGKLKPNLGECPPADQRTVSDIMCREAK